MTLTDQMYAAGATYGMPISRSWYLGRDDIVVQRDPERALVREIIVHPLTYAQLQHQGNPIRELDAIRDVLVEQVARQVRDVVGELRRDGVRDREIIAVHDLVRAARIGLDSLLVAQRELSAAIDRSWTSLQAAEAAFLAEVSS